MSLGINQCNFAGYIGKDPEVTTTDSGITRAAFSIAVTESWKDKSSGEKKEHTEWIAVQAWRKQAELIGEYFKKGDPIFITGKYKTREYEKDGKTQRFRFIEMERFYFLPKSKPTDVVDDEIPF